MEWAEHVTRTEDETKAQKSLFETAVLKGTLGRPRSKEEYNIKKDLKKM